MTDLASDLAVLKPRKPTFAEYVLSLNAEDRKLLDTYLLDPLVPIQALVPIMRKRCAVTKETLIEWRARHAR